MANNGETNWPAVEKEFIEGDWQSYKGLIKNLTALGIKCSYSGLSKHITPELKAKRQAYIEKVCNEMQKMKEEIKVNGIKERQTLIEQAKSLIAQKAVALLQGDKITSGDVNLLANALTKLSDMDKDNTAKENDKDALAEVVAKLEVNING